MSSNLDDSTSCTASNRPPDGPAVGADGDRPNRDRRVGRRSFVKGLGASAVGAAGLASSTGSADAFAITGTTVAAGVIGGLAAGAAGGAGLTYMMRDGIEGILGDGKDLSGYTGADALKTEIRTEATQMGMSDERVMTSIENNLANSETVAMAKGKAAALEKMNAEAPESEAVTAIEEAVNAYYATIQKNILTHADAMIDQFRHQINMVDAHADLTAKNFFRWQTGSEMWKANLIDSTSTTSVTLVDGTSVDSSKFMLDGQNLDGTSLGLRSVSFSQSTDKYAEYVPADGSDNIRYVDNARYRAAFNSASSRATTVITKLEGFAADLYAEYGAGDIPTQDVIDPVTASTQMGQNTGMAGQAAEAAMMGIPTSASFSLWLEIQDADGNTTEVEAEMYTTASPTDGSGNETGWEVGTTYDPQNFDPPIYIAYEYIDPESGEKSSDFIELDHPFTVVEATDEGGNEVTNVQNEERITQTADVSKLEEQLAQLRDEQTRLQEEAQSGGGGFSFDSLSVLGLPGEAIALGGAAVVSYFALGD